MSNNFYLKTKNDKNLIDEMYEFIHEHGLKFITKRDIEKGFVMPLNLHLCKITKKWKPLFEKSVYFSSYKELQEFFKKYKNVLQIVDDFGNKYSWTKFNLIINEYQSFEKVIGKVKNNYKDEDGFIWTNYSFD